MVCWAVETVRDDPKPCAWVSCAVGLSKMMSKSGHTEEGAVADARGEAVAALLHDGAFMTVEALECTQWWCLAWQGWVRAVP